MSKQPTKEELEEFEKHLSSFTKSISKLLFRFDSIDDLLRIVSLIHKIVTLTGFYRAMDIGATMGQQQEQIRAELERAYEELLREARSKAYVR